MLARLLRDERGQSLGEYGLILALVAIAVVAVLRLLGQGIASKFDQITSTLNGANP